uniref:Uncharacterized protein n=1 Tax=Romanomermis culicivorax TaxID=13658 RepID=A0A915J714_ROMCU
MAADDGSLLHRSVVIMAGYWLCGAGIDADSQFVGLVIVLVLINSEGVAVVEGRAKATASDTLAVLAAALVRGAGKAGIEPVTIFNIVSARIMGLAPETRRWGQRKTIQIGGSRSAISSLIPAVAMRFVAFLSFEEVVLVG